MTREEALNVLWWASKQHYPGDQMDITEYDIEAFDMAIAALRGPEWVRTADRLPERMELLPCSVRVLINSFMGVVTAQYDFEDGVWLDFFIHKHSPFNRPNYYGETMKVTHWAYLPKLPEVAE
jgi:hypothetical protein